MMRHNGKRRALAMLMAVMTAGACAVPALAAPIDSGVTPTYDEAYYATLDYYGNLMEGSVVKSYALNGAAGVTDYGVYDQVVNLTDATPVTLGEGRAAFQFQQAPDHFYFEGRTAQPFRELPWTITLRYTLNGVPVRAEELAGQRGVVEILMDVVPNGNASAYARYNYTLEAMALFNQDDILSLEAPGAQVQLVGNLRTVLFMALPGEEEHFTIRVGSDDFAFDGMTILMVPATLGQLEEIAKLSQRRDELEEDYRALSGSLDAMLDALSGIQNGLYASADGLDRLDTARDIISSGKGPLYDQADRVHDSTGTVLEGAGTVLDSAGTVLDSTGPVLDNAGTVLDSTGPVLDDTKGLLDGLGSLLDSTDVLGSDLDAVRELGTGFRLDLTGLAGQLDTVEQRVQALSGTVTSAKGTLNGLTDTAVSLKGDLDKLEKSLKALGSGTGDLKSFLEDTAAMKKDLNSLKQALNNAKVSSSLDISGTSFEQVAALHNAYSAKDETKFFEYLLTAQGAEKPAETAKGMAQLLAGYNAAVDAKFAEAQAAGLPVTREQVAEQVKQAMLNDPDHPEYKALEQVLTLHQLFGAKGGMTFQAFCAAVLKDEAQAAQIAQLWEVYKKAGEIQGDLSSTLNSVTKPTAAVVGGLADLCGQLDDIVDLLDDAKDLTDALRGAVPKLNSALDSVDTLRQTLNGYEPTLQEGLASMGRLTTSAAKTLRDTEALLGAADTLLGDGRDVASGGKDLMYDTKDVLSDALGVATDTKDLLSDTLDVASDTKDLLSDARDVASGTKDAASDTRDLLGGAKDLMRTSGVPLDEGTRRTLQGLAASLRQTGLALAATQDVKDAKNTLSGIIEDTWDEYTGEVNNLLLMDAGAQPVSLTDPRNPTPSSVQILIRTQEIKADEGEETGLKAETLSVRTAADAGEPVTFWGRVAQMFKDLWMFVTGIFR